MSTFDQWSLLLRMHGRVQWNRARAATSRSRLMLSTIVVFLLIYLVSAYFLFGLGLRYIDRLPAVGGLLGDRLIYILFFSLMLMLLFSAAITGFIALYRSRDTRWLLSLPISHEVVFMWKCCEASLFASWGLIFVLAPLLLAFGQSREVPWVFYVKAVLLLTPFLISVCAIGSLLVIGMSRWLTRRVLACLAGVIILVISGSLLKSYLTDREFVSEAPLSAALTFNRVLHHTQIAASRWIPSTWMAANLVEWSRPFRAGPVWLHISLLTSHALFFLMLLQHAGRHWFHNSWNRLLQAQAKRRSASLLSKTSSERAIPKTPTELPKLPKIASGIGRPLGAVAWKDWLTFTREPAQWVQFAIVFGLLAIYSAGLRQMNGNLGEGRDLFLVAFLNLAVCGLALSTLTTRFVFPQFSLEGRRLWILAMSPLPLPRIIYQKFASGAVACSLLVTAILLISGISLQLPWSEIAFFAVAVIALATGLNALAVGLGVIFPNLEESNTAKMVSGFGGTLCLVASFAFIGGLIMALVYARWDVFATNQVDPFWLEGQRGRTGMGAAAALTLITTTLPLLFAKKVLKRLEILADL